MKEKIRMTIKYESEFIVLIIILTVFSVITNYGMTNFVIRWNDRTQLAKKRNLSLSFLISSIPGNIFLIIMIFVHGITQEFITYWVMNTGYMLGITLVISIISSVIVTKSLPYHEFQSMKILQKGKPLLKVEDLKISYPIYGGLLKNLTGELKAVNGVSFEIRTGEILGIVGESGCGKSSIANSLLGIVEKKSGTIYYHQKPIPEIYPQEIRQKIQMVFQDPDATLNPRMKIVDIISEPYKNLLGILNKNELRRRVLFLLELVSLKREHMDRFPHELSGGQKQRIIIARALSCSPELLVLDEPTSALDVSVQAQILNLLQDLQIKYGYGYMFITHNLSVVNHIADRVAVMYLGKFVEIGSKEQIFKNPSHPYTQALLKSRLSVDLKCRDENYALEGEVPSPVNTPSGCQFHPRCTSHSQTENCKKIIPVKHEIEEGHFIWCHCNNH